MKLKPVHGLTLALAAGAGVLVHLGTRSAGPVAMAQYTELREGPLQEHLVTKEELGLASVPHRFRYPSVTAPGLVMLAASGFAPLWQAPDPQIAALPAEQSW